MMKQLKHSLPLCSLLFMAALTFGSANSAHADEDYKSTKSTANFTAGVSAGLGLVDSYGGVILIPNIAAKIVPNGFIPEIVNPVFLELQFGPMFTSGEIIWNYSTHLRWDFIKDAKWTFFALGGVGGNFMNNTKLGNRNEMYPRFGVGTFYQLNDLIALRGDFSHEMITMGMAIAF